ncbi:hypothetical protein [Facklamia sp. P9177]|uniref:hypothetical protein n=1 Tax=Facklamia sp. P9177 TaxID=3421945 RepID=UPI003D181CD6
MNYEREIVITAALHDLIEDTDCTILDIQKKWGSFISKIVDSLTVKNSGITKLEAFYDSIERSIIVGKESLIVRVLDVIDNMDYFDLADEEDKKYLREKYSCLSEVCKREIPKESSFLYFQDKFQRMFFKH